MLADGRLMTVGGDTRDTGLGVRDVNLYDPQTNAWSELPPMAESPVVSDRHDAGRWPRLRAVGL